MSLDERTSPASDENFELRSEEIGNRAHPEESENRTTPQNANPLTDAGTDEEEQSGDENSIAGTEAPPPSLACAGCLSQRTAANCPFCMGRIIDLAGSLAGAPFDLLVLGLLGDGAYICASIILGRVTDVATLLSSINTVQALTVIINNHPLFDPASPSFNPADPRVELALTELKTRPGGYGRVIDALIARRSSAN